MKNRRGQAGIIAAIFVILIIVIAIVSMYEIMDANFSFFNTQNQIFNNQVAKSEENLIQLPNSNAPVTQQYNVSSIELANDNGQFSNYTNTPPYLYELDGHNGLSLSAYKCIFNFNTGSGYQTYKLAIGGKYTNDPNESFINVYSFNHINGEWEAIFSFSLQPNENFNFLINLPSTYVSAYDTSILLNGTYLSSLASKPLNLSLSYLNLTDIYITASTTAAEFKIAPINPSAVNYSKFEAIPIIIDNGQASPTPSPFQEMIAVNITNENAILLSDGFNTINTNGSNVRFFASTSLSFNSELYAWLEGISGGVATYWVKIPGVIPGNSQITLWMVVENSSVNFNGIYLGEAPELSSVYGQYDNGQNVFDYYAVNPTSITEWNISGKAGITATAPSGSHYSTDSAFYANSASGDYMYTYVPLLAKNEIISFDVYTTGLGNVYFLANANGAGQMVRLDSRGGADYSGLATTNSWTSWTAPSSGLDERPNTWYQYDIVVSGSSATAYIGPASNNLATFGSTANSLIISVDGKYLGLVGDALGSSYITYWNGFVIRAYPPNGIMPSISFGIPESIPMQIQDLFLRDGESFVLPGSSSANMSFAIPSSSTSLTAFITLGSVSADTVSISMDSVSTNHMNLLESVKVSAGQEIQLLIPVPVIGNSTIISIKPTTITEVDQATLLANQSAVLIENDGPQTITVISAWLISNASATHQSVSIIIPSGSIYDLSPFFENGVYEVKLVTSLGNTFTFFN